MAMRSIRSPRTEILSENTIEERIIKHNGDDTVRRYEKGKFLGKGGFARVYELKNWETGKIYAAKCVLKSSLTKARAKQKLMSEIKIHRSLKNENIVSFEHFFEDNETVYILLELCTNQTTNELVKRRKRLHEIEVQCYMLQLINALKYWHQHRVIHRDLKLGNLFLNENMQVKLGDFGLATKVEFEGEKKRTICGTPNYIAPEILDGKQGHSYQVDVWSLGVILYTMIIGKPPFETSDVKTTYRRIRMNAYAFPEHVKISSAAKSLISRILSTDPMRRPTLDQISQHEFFNNGVQIPRTMPASTLACPPSQSYLRQFLPDPEEETNQSGGLRHTESTPSLLPIRRGSNEVPNLVGTHQNFRRSSNEGINLAATHENMASSPNSSLPRSLNTAKKQSSARASALGSQRYAGQTEIWVRKWVDYSSKYGLGYLLTNGCIGVYFNDATKIVLNTWKSTFLYYDSGKEEKADQSVIHTLKEFPTALSKKVALLKHFRNYLEGEAPREEELGTAQVDDFSVYVKKWLRTKHAILFRLSNKIVQVNFQDTTEIILSSASRTVTYVNKRGERSLYPLATALESSNTEMTKRLKYSKEILTSMLNGGRVSNGQTGSTRK